MGNKRDANWVVTDHGKLTGLSDDDHTQYVKKAGDTMTGDLTLSGAPSSELHAATKAYVDANSGASPQCSVLYYDEAVSEISIDLSWQEVYQVTIPANTLVNVTGPVALRASVTGNRASGTGGLACRWEYGGTVVCASAGYSTWWPEYSQLLMRNSISVNNAQIGYMLSNFYGWRGRSTAAVDSTQDQNLRFLVDGNNALDQFDFENFIVEILRYDA